MEIGHFTCTKRTTSKVTCRDIGIKLLYKIMKVNKLYPKFFPARPKRKMTLINYYFFNFQ